MVPPPGRDAVVRFGLGWRVSDGSDGLLDPGTRQPSSLSMFHSSRASVSLSRLGPKFSTQPFTRSYSASTSTVLGWSTQSRRRNPERQDHPAVLELLVIAPGQVGHRPDERCVTQVANLNQPRRWSFTGSMCGLRRIETGRLSVLQRSTRAAGGDDCHTSPAPL